MCLSCGCWLPVQTHGDPASLVLPDLLAAADAAGISAGQAAWNIPRTLTLSTSPAWPPVLGALTVQPTLIWDMDGILAFTAEAMCAALNARYGTSYDPQTQRFFQGTIIPGSLPADQMTWLMGELTGFSVFSSCAPDWRAADTMRDAATAGYSCTIVTERHPLLAADTGRWLTGWGIKPPRVFAVGPGNKPAWLGERFGPGNPAVLVDDNPVTRMTVARPGIDVWLPARPYVPRVSRDHVRVFDSWQVARYWLGLSPEP
jgi:hypothetical protein